MCNCYECKLKGNSEPPEDVWEGSPRDIIGDAIAQGTPGGVKPEPWTERQLDSVRRLRYDKDHRVDL